jgi:hypothetical protein
VDHVKIKLESVRHVLVLHYCCHFGTTALFATQVSSGLMEGLVVFADTGFCEKEASKPFSISDLSVFSSTVTKKSIIYIFTQ